MDSETLKSNLCPISVLPAVSKITERVLFDQLYEFSLNFLSDNIFGFLKIQSGATGLLKTCENIRTSLDCKEHTMAITIDLSKAFDSIYHNLPFAKLAACGVTDEPCIFCVPT